MTKVPKYLFTIGCIAAILLNIITIIAILTGARKLFITQRLEVMDIKAAFSLEKQTILTSVINALPKSQAEQLTPLIIDAFENGTKLWEDSVLPEFLGKRRSEEFLRSMEEEITPLKPNNFNNGPR